MVLELIRTQAAPSERGEALGDLATQIAGEVIYPSHPEYESARQVWNRVADRYPGLIVRAADALDVAQAVQFARARDLPLAVRSGGHSLAGQSTVDYGVVVDVSRMKRMTIDPERRIARAQAGLTWGEYAGRAQAYGLTTPAGDSSTVGVGGLALGGGIGWLARKHGLTVDHVQSVEVVTADGQLLRASEDEHPDLFWALRGGGGNFGIATEFEFRLQQVGTVLGGAIFLPAEPEVLLGYAQAAAEAPEELTTIASVMQAPPLPFIPAEKRGSPVFAILVCYAGDVEVGQRALAPLRSLGPVVGEQIGPMPYPALFQMTAAGEVPGPHHVRSGFMDRLGREEAETIVDYARQGTSPYSMAQLRVLGGAMARVPADATAFAHRDKPILLTIINGWSDAAESARHVAWTETFWQAMRPYSNGAYVNFLAQDGPERIREAYPGATYERLVAIKRRYDPTNFFRGNQNIQP
jgi:FAD/FMN-containing dehydrogenase